MASIDSRTGFLLGSDGLFPDFASVFGRHEFLIRRLHSLMGLFPIGGYLVFHLATNAAILDGGLTYQYRADQIHRLGPTTILILEWSLIFLPILLHGLVGLLIVTRGKRNVRVYPYEGNLRYTLQRWSGVIAFCFVLWHVSQMHGWFRFHWWVQYVARPLGGARFDPANAVTAAIAIQAHWWVFALYLVGTLASVYHLANGVWTMGITWGVWTSPRAQQWAKAPCFAFGIGLAIVGVGALIGMYKVSPDSFQRQQESAEGVGRGEWEGERQVARNGVVLRDFSTPYAHVGVPPLDGRLKPGLQPFEGREGFTQLSHSLIAASPRSEREVLDERGSGPW